MPLLIDTSLWIDFTRTKSPAGLKRFIAPHILHADAHLAEPITFEILRHATPEEHKLLTRQFQTFPVLSTPPDLWEQAASLGRAARKKGLNLNSLDLLIATVAIHHQATLITFDEDFTSLAAVSSLSVKHLTRPAT